MPYAFVKFEINFNMLYLKIFNKIKGNETQIWKFF